MNPFSPEKPYLAYSDVLKQKFGTKVYKLTLDAGFTCPNRTGEKGVGGCTFCDDTGSSSRAQDKKDNIREQLLKNMERMRPRFKAEKFVAYFQSYTNTYGKVERLKRLYDEAMDTHEDIIGLAISTRPDCVDEEKLDLIASYKKPDNYICVEYGMQTIHNETLEKVNRCETYQDFLHAYQLTKEREIPMCVHVILGMPGETHDMMMQTAEALSELKPEGVKIHMLCAMKNTPLEQDYLKGNWTPLEQDQYVKLVCDFVERLDPSIALHRLTANGHRDGLIAPRWLLKKFEVLEDIHTCFRERNSYQGKHLQLVSC